jgi:hypothetical protein
VVDSLDTATSNGLIIPAPSGDSMGIGGVTNGSGNRRNRRNKCLRTTVPTIYPTFTDLELIPGLHSERPASNDRTVWCSGNIPGMYSAHTRFDYRPNYRLSPVMRLLSLSWPLLQSYCNRPPQPPSKFLLFVLNRLWIVSYIIFAAGKVPLHNSRSFQSMTAV